MSEASLSLQGGIDVGGDDALDRRYEVADNAARDLLITQRKIKVGRVILHTGENKHYKLKTYPTPGSLTGVEWEESETGNKVPLASPSTLTDGSVVNIDTNNTDNQQYILASSNTSCTLEIANLADGHTFKLIITPQSAADHTYTFQSTGLTGKVAGAAGATLVLATSDDYIIFVSRAGGNIYISYDSRAY